MSKYLTEAFKQMEAFEDSTFTATPEGAKKLQQFLDGDYVDDVETIIDPNAENEEDLQDSYVGKVILNCPVCEAKIYKDLDEVIIDDEADLANVEEECPFCQSLGGFEIIGQVEEFDDNAADADKEDNDSEIYDEDTIGESLKEAGHGQHSSKSHSLKGVMASAIKAGQNFRKDQAAIKDKLAARRAQFQSLIDTEEVPGPEKLPAPETKPELPPKGDATALPNTEKPKELPSNPEVKQIEASTPSNTPIAPASAAAPVKVPVKTESKEAREANAKPIKEKIDSKLKEGYEDDLVEGAYYRGFIISKAGDKFMIDGFGESYDTYEDAKAGVDSWIEDDGIDPRVLNEDFKKVNIETDDSIMTMDSDGSGKVTVTTEPKQKAEGEVISPISDENKEKIIGANEEPMDEVDVEVDEFSEDDFDELGEGYLKKVYENVKSYKTIKGKIAGNKMVFEGIITFNSGKKAKTKFMFESATATKTGKVKFVGNNPQISRNSKAFTITGRVKGGKLVTESFTYNYLAKDAKTNKSKKLYGTINKK